MQKRQLHYFVLIRRVDKNMAHGFLNCAFEKEICLINFTIIKAVRIESQTE